jgi:hypothetical protein
MSTNNATNTSDPVSVSQGGTGVTSFTPYSVICGGTTSTNPLQNVVGLGNTNDVLVSNGASALPTWTSVPGTMELITTKIINNSTSANFSNTEYDINRYNSFLLVLNNLTTTTSTGTYAIQVSVNNNSSWLTSQYTSGIITNLYNSAVISNQTSVNLVIVSNTITSTNVSVNGTVTVIHGNAATFIGQIFTTETTPVFGTFQGTRNYSSGTIDSFRVILGSTLGAAPVLQTIDSGSISLYGFLA